MRNSERHPKEQSGAGMAIVFVFGIAGNGLEKKKFEPNTRYSLSQSAIRHASLFGTVKLQADESRNPSGGLSDRRQR